MIRRKDSCGVWWIVVQNSGTAELNGTERGGATRRRREAEPRGSGIGKPPTSCRLDKECTARLRDSLVGPKAPVPYQVTKLRRNREH